MDYIYVYIYKYIIKYNKYNENMQNIRSLHYLINKRSIGID